MEGLGQWEGGGGEGGEGEELEGGGIKALRRVRSGNIRAWSIGDTGHGTGCRVWSYFGVVISCLDFLEDDLRVL